VTSLEEMKVADPVTLTIVSEMLAVDLKPWDRADHRHVIQSTDDDEPWSDHHHPRTATSLEETKVAAPVTSTMVSEMLAVDLKPWGRTDHRHVI
jgi:hypothetical protein